jgi:hypothetical protein
MGITPKVRFAIFARDNFTCQYCGRMTPEVILEIDHILPRSEGGSDDPTNLVTSCFECNRGKGATILETLAPDTDLHEQAILVAEREMQVKEYNEARRKQREREDAEIDELLSFWQSLWQTTVANYPSIATLRKYLRVLAFEDIREAMEIAADRKWYDKEAVGYLYGILKNKAAQQNEVD